MPGLAKCLSSALLTVMLGAAAGGCDAAAGTGTASTPAAGSPRPTPAKGACVTSTPTGVCGPYSYRASAASNGYNTYVGNNMWAANGVNTTQTLIAYNPGRWSVTANAPSGNTAVLTYPNVNQLFTTWCGRGRKSCSNPKDTPVSELSSLTSAFAESMPHNSGTIAQAAYDIWLTGVGGTGSSEIMIWLDNVNRGTGGADQIGTASIGGQEFTVLRYGGRRGEVIFSLNGNERTGKVDILGVLKRLIADGHEPAGIAISQVDFGWEICSTGGESETFTVSEYSISECVAGNSCAG